MRSKGEPSHMAGQIEKVATIQVPEAELRIVDVTASTGALVRLQGVSAATAPRTGEKIELKEGTFKVVEVSHEFSGFAPEARSGRCRREAPTYSGGVNAFIG